MGIFCSCVLKGNEGMTKLVKIHACTYISFQFISEYIHNQCDTASTRQRMVTGAWRAWKKFYSFYLESTNSVKAREQTLPREKKSIMKKIGAILLEVWWSCSVFCLIFRGLCQPCTYWTIFCVALQALKCNRTAAAKVRSELPNVPSNTCLTCHILHLFTPPASPLTSLLSLSHITH